LLWLVSSDIDRTTQIDAGLADVRVQLSATAAGTALQPLQQALQEYPEQAEPHAEIRKLLDAGQPGRTVRLWACAGYAQPVGPAPRRGVEAQWIKA
jgi:hypothetical protein